MRYDDEQQADDLPEELRQALKSSERAISMLTPGVDREILARADQHFSSRSSSRKSRLAAPAWVAIAATLVLAVFIGTSQQLVDRLPQPVFADHDRSGQIDIADLLWLAKSGEPPAQDELDAFAQRLVALRATGDAS